MPTRSLLTEARAPPQWTRFPTAPRCHRKAGEHLNQQPLAAPWALLSRSEGFEGRLPNCFRLLSASNVYYNRNTLVEIITTVRVERFTPRDSKLEHNDRANSFFYICYI